ncbi:defensin alpha 5-like [Nycticebus coucang]|uniref:defensin alpha 5-like n=1 Tax=Nycticebus coucang TaxID=9470 RepID=UPI00234D25E8|nr:defensin alpha 5-like [Nycticebus coucang]
MRTLTLLTALLLVALQAQAETLQERAEEAAAEEQPRAEGQDVAISFAGIESSALRAAGPQGRATCYCRTTCCDYPEVHTGYCTQNGRRYRFCCR